MVVEELFSAVQWNGARVYEGDGSTILLRRMNKGENHVKYKTAPVAPFCHTPGQGSGLMRFISSNEEAES